MSDPTDAAKTGAQAAEGTAEPTTMAASQRRRHAISRRLLR